MNEELIMEIVKAISYLDNLRVAYISRIQKRMDILDRNDIKDIVNRLNRINFVEKILLEFILKEVEEALKNEPQ